LRKISAFLAILLFVITTTSALASSHWQSMTTQQGPLTFGSYASFNDSYTQCVGSNGSYYWTGIFQTFARAYYAPCRTQMLADIDFLGQHNVKSIRLWPVLSTFAYNNNTKTWGNLNSNITNLDEVLAELAKYHMQAYLTLMSPPDCSDPPETTTLLGNYFNPDLINNTATQDHFTQALRAFITRYKNNTAISAYDLVNEATFILDNPPTSSSQGYCNLPYDLGNFTKTKALFARMYYTATNIDKLHRFTFSFTQPYAMNSPMQNAFANIVDFYDVDAYSLDPGTFYSNFPTYDKPVIDGEVGIPGTQYDANGNDCEGIGSNYYKNILPAMAPECQQMWLANAQAFVSSAQQHHVQALFFHQWSVSKAYGVHLYDSNNHLTGYQLTTAGQYIMSLAQGSSS